ncbi:hypothetical protein KNJ79_10440 [Sphingopyxis indica]|uniref:hypothetical protein n=1 Tax=Sphingopyxis indica TaxID=436663 RepID=UPI002938F314|nr:hypothetical protein [Sphingopyxis indica]WOF41683.1 hypothetical protein KNJ79_10440 [Sphingopyxis indica]
MSERDQAIAANDNGKIFAYFMDGYWNQMAPDLYASFDAALDDFRETEGEHRLAQLQTALAILHRQGRFPSIANISDAYQDPFWKPYDRILTAEDLASCKAAL